MSLYEQTKRKETREHIANAAYNLANLLQKAPSTLHDDGPNGTWIDTVDRLSKGLIEMLGGLDGVKVMLDFMKTLNTRAEEARLFVSGTGCGQPGEISWFCILDWAKNAAVRERTADALFQREREEHAKTRHLHLEELRVKDVEIHRLHVRCEILRERARSGGWKTVG